MTHPIAPPPELVQQWAAQLEHLSDQVVFSEIAQWGADQELEACCEWLFTEDYEVAPVRLRAGRRPKPPSLKQQALEAVMRMWNKVESHEDWQLVRRALEALPE